MIILDIQERKKKIHNKSLDYDINKDYLNNNRINNRVNIYQRLFHIKMNNITNLKQAKKEKLKFNSNGNIEQPKTINIKTSSNLDVFSDDEIIQNKIKVKTNIKKPLKNIKDNNINVYKNLNNSQKKKSFLEDDITSINSKNSIAQRQNTLNSSLSYNSCEKFIQTYERFKEIQIKKKEKIEKLKKLNEEKEKKNCYFSPKINYKSKKIKDDFYSRQKKKIEEQKKKNEDLKNKIKKKKEEEINKNNILLKKKNNKKQKMLDINKTINELYEWDINRKKKINDKKKTIDEKNSKEITHKPKINKNSQKLAKIKLNKNDNYMNNKNLLEDKDNLFERLYRDDTLRRKEKLKILNQIYCPTFTPNLYKKKVKIEYNREESDDEKKIIYNNKNNYDYDNNDRNDDSDNYSEIHEIYLNNDCAQLIRTRLFKKIKNNKNYSAVNLMRISEIKSEDESNNNEESDNNENQKDFEKNRYKKIKNDKRYNSTKKIKINIKVRDIFNNYKKRQLLLGDGNKKKNNNKSIEF